LLAHLPIFSLLVGGKDTQPKMWNFYSPKPEHCPSNPMA